MFALLSFQTLSAQQNTSKPSLFFYDDISLHKNADTISAEPLQTLVLTNATGSSIKVFDGNGKQYFSSDIKPITTFTVGGALGKQVVRMYNNQHKTIDSIVFMLMHKPTLMMAVIIKTCLIFFIKACLLDEKEGVYPVTWNGNTYHVFVPWVLDNFHTMKGMKYFLPNGKELIDIMRQSQRDDGMIYSFIQYHAQCDYFLTRDKFSGYSKKIGDKVFVRQPVENHPEYFM